MGETDGIKRVYVDNSVVSGMFDAHLPKRVLHMQRFWQAVLDRKLKIIASDVLEAEVRKAPIRVRDFFDNLPPSQIEWIKSTDESDDLAAQYIGANVITENHLTDCKHIALATTNNADAVVSWNCDDMVNPSRIPKFNNINKQAGYNEIEILTPDAFLEVFYDEA